MFIFLTYLVGIVNLILLHRQLRGADGARGHEKAPPDNQTGRLKGRINDGSQ